MDGPYDRNEPYGDRPVPDETFLGRHLDTCPSCGNYLGDCTCENDEGDL